MATTSTVSCKGCKAELNISGSTPVDWSEEDAIMTQFEEQHANCVAPQIYRSVPNPSIREVTAAEALVAELLGVDPGHVWKAGDIPFELWCAAVNTAESTTDLDPEDRRAEVLETIAKYRRALAAVGNPSTNATWSAQEVSVTWAAWPLAISGGSNDLDIEIFGHFSPSSSSPVGIVVADAEVSVAELRQLRDNCDRALEVAELLGLGD